MECPLNRILGSRLGFLQAAFLWWIASRIACCHCFFDPMKLRQIARIARAAGAAPGGMSRRRFVELTLAAGAGLMLPAAAFGRPEKPKARVVVVGAGFAGLSCAWQLRRAGAGVTVLEARNRVGGRVHTLDNFIDGALVEAGAELIGSNHPTWLHYAKHFGLRMRDVTEEEDAEAPIFLNGRRVPSDEVDALWEEMDSALSLMNADARKVDPEAPWAGEDAKALDHTSIAEVASRWDVSTKVRAAALAALANDNVMRPDRASYLALLCSIAGGGFERYWTESEVFRCESGSQSLAFQLAEAVGEENIHLGRPVAEIGLREDGAIVKDANGVSHEADFVVLTVPPPAWRNFRIDPPLPEGCAVNCGPAIKYLSKVSSPFWAKEGLAPDSLSDSEIGWTWNGTADQRTDRDKPECLIVFSGGRAAEECLAFPAAERTEEFAKRLEKIYPGYTEAFEKGIFAGWPEEKWTQCGYSSPTLGQVTEVYPNYQTAHAGRMYFAGEYTNLAFKGFMEGALQSGALTAKTIAKALGLS
jgi:monoamine oxidase